MNDKDLIRATRELGSSGINLFNITTYGFENYAHKFIERFDELVSQTLAAIINKDLSTNDEVSRNFNIPKALADYILDILKNRGYVKLVRTMGGNVSILDVTVSGKRAARSL